MNILYLITINSHGKGGHINSLYQISEEIRKNNFIQIVTIGYGSNDFIKISKSYYNNIKFNGINIIYLIKSIKKIIQKYKIEIIHCFDVEVYSIIQIYNSILKVKNVLTLCGGKNPRIFPSIENLILFSDENYNWFKSRKKYKNKNIEIIRNRVKKVEINKNIFNKKNNENFNIMRICRIGKAYRKSIFDSMTLLDELNIRNIKNIKLIIIGVIEDHNIYNEIREYKSRKNLNIEIITDNCITKEASKMLCLADLVVGTGRSAVEAASIKKPVLLINSNSNIPVLLDDKNIFNAMKVNFSQRCKLNNSNNLEKIISIVNDQKEYIKYGEYAYNMFKEYYDVNMVNKKYISFYKNVMKRKNIKYIDIIIYVRYTVKFFYYFLKNRYKFE